MGTKISVGAGRARARMARRCSMMLVALAPILLGVGVFGAGTLAALAAEPRMSEAEVRALVRAAPKGLSRTVALRIMASPRTRYRIDHNGYPAWTWRDAKGNAGWGGCVHVHPRTGEPYLETQFPEGRKRTAAKYIDYGMDGRDWHGRFHPVGNLNVSANWKNPVVHRSGLEVARELRRRVK